MPRPRISMALERVTLEQVTAVVAGGQQILRTQNPYALPATRQRWLASPVKGQNQSRLRPPLGSGTSSVRPGTSRFVRASERDPSRPRSLGADVTLDRAWGASAIDILKHHPCTDGGGFLCDLTGTLAPVTEVLLCR